MRRTQEVSNLNSCINRALETEMIFTLLGRDEAAPVAIRAWVEERLRLGKNKSDDPQIVDAIVAAATMEKERDSLRTVLAAR